ncbi:MAG: hypothetical protein ABW124_18780 [Candidatus Thiodiazotropha sp. 6PLUC9]
MFKGTTKQLASSPGRGFEITIGILVAFAAVIFWWLIWVIGSSVPIALDSIIGIFVMALIAIWISQLSYRLLFNKRRKDGGLFAAWSLKVWLVFLGISSVAMVALGLTTSEYRMALGATGMFVACVAGWQVAKRRSQCSTKT